MKCQILFSGKLKKKKKKKKKKNGIHLSSAELAHKVVKVNSRLTQLKYHQHLNIIVKCIFT